MKPISLFMQDTTIRITIRQAAPGDKVCLQQIYCQTIDYTCLNEYDATQREAWKRGAENQLRWDQALSGQYFLVAEIAGEIAGFASLEGNSYIDFMYTHKDHLRKGIARLLYTKLQEKAIQTGASFLTADVSKTARPFFEKMGFVVLHENNKLIRGAWISNYKMRKEL
jgi:putative acetyltransferase